MNSASILIYLIGRISTANRKGVNLFSKDSSKDRALSVSRSFGTKSRPATAISGSEMRFGSKEKTITSIDDDFEEKSRIAAKNDAKRVHFASTPQPNTKSKNQIQSRIVRYIKGTSV